MMAELKTQRVTGIFSPMKTISTTEQQSGPITGTSVCFQIGEFECPISTSSSRKQCVLSRLEKLTKVGSNSPKGKRVLEDEGTSSISGGRVLF